jgi:hypothetical protein
LTVTSDVTDSGTGALSVTLNYFYRRADNLIALSPQLAIPMNRMLLPLRGVILTYFTARIDVQSDSILYVKTGDAALVYWVSATDGSGNVASSAQKSVTVSYCPAPIR